MKNLILLTFPKSQSVPLELYNETVVWIERCVTRACHVEFVRVAEITKSSHGTVALVLADDNEESNSDVKRELIAEKISKEFEITESKHLAKRFGIPFAFVREQSAEETSRLLEKALKQKDSLIEKLFEKIHRLENTHKTKIISHNTSKGEAIRLERIRLDRKLESAHEIMMREREEEIKKLNIYDLNDRICVARKRLSCAMRCAAFSPDGELVAVGLGGKSMNGRKNQKEGCVLILNTKDLSLHGDMSRHVTCVDRAQKLLASGDARGEVRLHRFPCVDDKAQSLRLVGHGSEVSALRFNSDGSVLYTVGAKERVICQWRVRGGSNGSSESTKEEE
eukprot:g7495.t1